MAKITNSKGTKEKDLDKSKKIKKNVDKTNIKVSTTTKKVASKVNKESAAIKKVAASATNKNKATIASKKENSKKESLKKKTTQKTTSDVITNVTENISKVAKDIVDINEELIGIAKSPISSSKKKKITSNEISKQPNNNIETDVTIENGNIIVKEKTNESTLKNFKIVEYYDLPYRYNKTVVKILAQTPTTLFVYWEISDDDIKKLLKQNGNDFFNHSKPVLIVTNDSKYYSFEVEVNDFANSWYINLPEANCKYSVELARKSCDYNYNSNNTDPIAVSYSNEIEMPNNKILYEDALNSLCYVPDGIYNANNCNVNKSLVYFKNIKTDSVVKKEFNTLTTKTIYDIYSLYKKMYGDDFLTTLSSSKLNLPSSGAISSFK